MLGRFQKWAEETHKCLKNVKFNQLLIWPVNANEMTIFILSLNWLVV